MFSMMTTFSLGLVEFASFDATDLVDFAPFEVAGLTGLVPCRIFGKEVGPSPVTFEDYDPSRHITRILIQIICSASATPQSIQCYPLATCYHQRGNPTHCTVT
jgi:hypothetical protein